MLRIRHSYISDFQNQELRLWSSVFSSKSNNWWVGVSKQAGLWSSDHATLLSVTFNNWESRWVIFICFALQFTFLFLAIVNPLFLLFFAICLLTSPQRREFSSNDTSNEIPRCRRRLSRSLCLPCLEHFFPCCIEQHWSSSSPPRLC